MIIDTGFWKENKWPSSVLSIIFASTKYNLADQWKTPDTLEWICGQKHVCIYMFPHKNTQTSILAFQCRKPAVEIKGRGINKIHGTKNGETFHSCFCHHPHNSQTAPFPHLTQKYRLNKKPWREGNFQLRLLSTMNLCLGDVQLPKGGCRSRCMHSFVAVVMNLWSLRGKKYQIRYRMSSSP